MSEHNSRPLRVVVLGGGPAGIAAAHLAQQQGNDVTLVEQCPWLGGKGASRRTGGYILDFGPHAFHPKTRAINDLITGHAGADYLLGPVRMELILAGRRLRYPFQLTEGLLKLPPSRSARLILDFLAARLFRSHARQPDDSFKSWGERQFGLTMYRMCFGDYTERVWGVPASELSVELAMRKLPRLSIRGVIADLLFKRGKMHAHLFGNDFGYHRHGIGRIFEAIGAEVVRGGGRVLCDHEVIALRAGSGGRIASVVTSGPTGLSEHPCDQVISTLPLTQLGTLLAAAGLAAPVTGPRLSFRDIVLVYAELRRPAFSPAHWTYLVDSRFSFHRISEQKNLTPACCPAETTMLTLETSATACPKGGDELRRCVEADLGFFGIGSHEIGTIETYTLCDSYPIYRTGYEAALAGSLERLGTITNLVSTGRQGLFLDIDMHDAMVLGRAGVEALAGGQVPEFYREHETVLRKVKAEG